MTYENYTQLRYHYQMVQTSDNLKKIFLTSRGRRGEGEKVGGYVGGGDGGGGGGGERAER